MSFRWCCCVVLLAAKYRKMWYHGVFKCCVMNCPSNTSSGEKKPTSHRRFLRFCQSPIKKEHGFVLWTEEETDPPHANLLRPFRREVQEEQWENSPQHRHLETPLAAPWQRFTLFPTSTSTDDGERNKGSTVNSISRVYVLGMSRRKSENVKFDDEKSSTWTSFRKGEGGLQNRAKIWTTLSPMRSPFWTWILQNIPDHPCVLLQGSEYLDGRMSCPVHKEKKRHQTTRCRLTLKEQERKV